MPGSLVSCFFLTCNLIFRDFDSTWHGEEPRREEQVCIALEIYSDPISNFVPQVSHSQTDSTKDNADNRQLVSCFINPVFFNSLHSF